MTPWFRLMPPGSRMGLLLAIFCSFVVLASCRAPLLNQTFNADPSIAPGDAAATLKWILHNPFAPQDHAGFAQRAMTQTVLDKRGIAPTVRTGKAGLTLEECRSLAIRNNLEVEAARVNELTKKAVTYSTRTKMMPQFLFSGELSERDNPPYSYSDVLGQEGVVPQPGVGGTGVTSFSTGHERSTWRYVMETRWSPTDAALAYYLTRSNLNDSLKAHYQKVRVAQKLVGVVDAAFFRLLWLEHALPIAQQHESVRADIAQKVGDLLEEKYADVQRYHQAKKNATKARRMVLKLQNEVERQRNLLATAIGLSPERCMDGGFFVVGELDEPKFWACLSDLEMEGIRNRPEGYEAGLNHLNSVNDLKRTIVKYCPRVTGFWRFTRDKDKYLRNRDWKDVGMLVYFDLTEWISNGYERKATATTATRTYKELGALALAITSQVRLAALKYFDAKDELTSAEMDLASSEKVVSVARTRAAMDDLDRLAAKEASASVLQDRIERLRAVGEANAALGELRAEMGVNYNEPYKGD